MDKLIEEEIMNKNDKDFLLKSYGEMYNSECGPWNISLTSKWLEYEITKFFEENFNLDNCSKICNIGIGAGFWDRYLSYKMTKDCLLVSIDKDYECCKQLELCLINEENPNKVEIINNDIMGFGNTYKFDLITIIGSTIVESGIYKEIINKILSMLKEGGSLFYNSLDIKETKEDLLNIIDENRYVVKRYDTIENYGRKIIHAKIIRIY
mgnify:CR=1 FL=1|jgi:cyclopropane fatty-acyl-phospholipid synthase-like methyltransferase